MWRADTPRRQLVADAALGLVLGAYGQIEVWLPSVGDPGSLPGPPLAISLAWLVVAGCVAFRRRAPFAALAVATVAVLLQAAVYGAPEGSGGFLPFLALYYSVAAYERLPLAVAGLGIAIASAIAQAYLDPLNEGDEENLVASLAFSGVIVVAWGAGFLVRRRREAARARREEALAAARARQDAARQAVQDERARIARELHDVVSHALSIVVVQSEVADELMDADPERARRAVDSIRRTAREGLVEMRRMLGVLRAVDDDGRVVSPGLADLPALAEEVTAAGLPVDLIVDRNGRTVSAGVEISAYRIVQEALTNALRHAQATRVTVRVRCEGSLQLDVEDDGVGPAGDGSGGLGLGGIRERVAALRGELQAGAGDRGGFRIRAVIPLEDVS